MPESHIVHATATFSELGIAAASVLLADLPKWRNLADAEQADPIAVNDLLVSAKRIGGLFYWINVVIAWIPPAINKLIFAAPFLSFGFGLYALIGISLYPPLLLSQCSFFAVCSSNIDMVYWYMAVCSFGIAMLSAVIERSRSKLIGVTIEATTTEF